MIEAAEDRDYFERRAEAEIEAAQAATHAAVVRAHYELAGHYLDLVHNPDKAALGDDRDESPAIPGLRIIGAGARH